MKQSEEDDSTEITVSRLIASTTQNLQYQSNFYTVNSNYITIFIYFLPKSKILLKHSSIKIILMLTAL